MLLENCIDLGHLPVEVRVPATFCVLFSVLPLPRSIIMTTMIIIMPIPLPMPMPNRGVQFRSELKSYHFDSLFFGVCWFGGFRRSVAFFRVWTWS